MVRVVMKFGNSDETIGSLTFDRENPEGIIGERPLLVFTGFSGSSEYAPVPDRDTDVVLRVFGFDSVTYGDASATDKETEQIHSVTGSDKQSAMKANAEYQDSLFDPSKSTAAENKPKRTGNQGFNLAPGEKTDDQHRRDATASSHARR